MQDDSSDTAAPPLGFSPPRVYVLDAVWEQPEAARRAEGFCAACPDAEVRTFACRDLPQIVIEEGWDVFPKMGTLNEVPPPRPLLTLARFDEEAVAADAARMGDAYGGEGSFPWHEAAGGRPWHFFTSGMTELRPCPEHVCRPQWRLHFGRGCPHRCTYCALGSYILQYVNVEEMIGPLAELLRRNPWQKTWLLDDVMDVPTTEPQMDALGPFMRFFEGTGDRYLIIHTKSDRVDGLIRAGSPRKTIVTWSLSGPTQSRLIEPAAGTTEGRIEAARRCQEAGLQIRYKFKPIVPVRNWREEAAQTVELALERTRPDNLSLTCLMWMQAEDMVGCIDPDLLDPEFLDAAREAAPQMRGVRVAPFPAPMRERIYRHYLSEIRRRDPDIPVTLCTESLGMWRALGDELGTAPDSYVCGCGAGATPGLTALRTSPWSDARAAVDWRGRPALPPD